MTRTLNSVSFLEGAEASFTCQAIGIPAPQFKWLLKGSEYIDGALSTTTQVLSSTVIVESTLVLSPVMERHTGAVTCVAFHEKAGQTVTTTSSASLVVLSECRVWSGFCGFCTACKAAGLAFPTILLGWLHSTKIVVSSRRTSNLFIYGPDLSSPDLSMHGITQLIQYVHARSLLDKTLTWLWPLAANNFEVYLSYQDGQVLVAGTLPAFIAGCFSLQVRYYSTESVIRTESVVISDPSLAYTDVFNVVIPDDKLPSFSSFSVAIAISSNDNYGPFTLQSDPIGMYVLITVYTWILGPAWNPLISSP